MSSLSERRWSSKVLHCFVLGKKIRRARFNPDGSYRRFGSDADVAANAVSMVSASKKDYEMDQI